jgi:DNA-binding NarL/FixJ family response regulator
MSTKIVIADDHELFADGLEKLIRANQDYQVVEKFKNGVEVMEYIDRGGQVDLLVLDLNMPKMDGTQLMGYLHRNQSPVKVLVVSMHHSQSTMESVRKLAVKGYIGKDSSVSELLTAIDEVLKGNEYFNDAVTEEASATHEDHFGGIFGAYGLSKREVEIIRLIINQYEGGEIADILHLSPLTVKTHRKNIFRKLGVRNLAGVFSLVQKSGISGQRLD